MPLVADCCKQRPTDENAWPPTLVGSLPFTQTSRSLPAVWRIARAERRIRLAYSGDT